MRWRRKEEEGEGKEKGRDAGKKDSGRSEAEHEEIETPRLTQLTAKRSSVHICFPSHMTPLLDISVNSKWEKH